MSNQNDKSKNISTKSNIGSSISIARSNGMAITRLSNIRSGRMPPTTRSSFNTSPVSSKPKIDDLSKTIDMMKTTIDVAKTRLLNASVRSNEDLQKKYNEAVDKINQLESENNILRRKLEIILSQTNMPAT